MYKKLLLLFAIFNCIPNLSFSQNNKNPEVYIFTIVPRAQNKRYYKINKISKTKNFIAFNIRRFYFYNKKLINSYQFKCSPHVHVPSSYEDIGNDLIIILNKQNMNNKAMAKQNVKKLRFHHNISNDIAKSQTLVQGNIGDDPPPIPLIPLPFKVVKKGSSLQTEVHHVITHDFTSNNGNSESQPIVFKTWKKLTKYNRPWKSNFRSCNIK